MVSVAVGIVKEEGFLRLWQGLSPGLARHVFYSGIRMNVYEQMRSYITSKSKKRDTLTLSQRIVCGMSAGAIGQFFGSPADLIKIQMQMEGRRRLLGYKPRVNGMLDALKQVVAKAGIIG